MLANFERDPGQIRDTRINAVLARPDADARTLGAITTRASALGVEVAPGVRCFEISGGYLSSYLWQRCAGFLRLVARETGSRFIAIDLEDYVYQARAPTLEAQREAIAPLIAAIRADGWRIAIYPALERDLVTQAIADALDGDLEIWTEDVFGLSEIVRTDPRQGDTGIARLAGIRARIETRWPRAVVRHGAYDHVLRSWGADQRTRALDLYGKHSPWVFDMIRRDNSAWGSAEWWTGASLSATNDSIAEWRFPPGSAWPVTARGSITMMPVSVIPGATRGDLRSDRGWLAHGGRAMRATALRGILAFSAVVEVELAPSGGVVFGASQGNSESWQVATSTDGSIVLELRTPSPTTVERVTLLASAPMHAPVRVGVSAADGGAVWRWAVQLGETPAVTGEHRPRGRVSVGAGALWIGAGTTMPTYRVRGFEGLVARRVELWHRQMNTSELAGAVPPFPRY